MCRNFLVLYNLVYQFGHLSPGLWALLENHCLSYVFALFYSPGFRFLGLLIYLELIFVQCERQGRISVLHRDIQMSQYHMLRHYSFPRVCPWSLCCEMKMVGFISWISLLAYCIASYKVPPSVSPSLFLHTHLLRYTLFTLPFSVDCKGRSECSVPLFPFTSFSFIKIFLLDFLTKVNESSKGSHPYLIKIWETYSSFSPLRIILICYAEVHCFRIYSLIYSFYIVSPFAMTWIKLDDIILIEVV